MARNEEKQLARLNRYYLEKQKQEELLKRPPRPKLETLNTSREIKKWLPTILRDIEFYVTQMEVTCYSESKLEEFSQHIQQLKSTYRAFVQKLRSLEPDYDATPWTNKPYASLKRHINSAALEVAKENSVETEVSEPSSPVPKKFIPISTPILLQTGNHPHGFPQHAFSVQHIPTELEDQPLQFVLPNKLSATTQPEQPCKTDPKSNDRSSDGNGCRKDCDSDRSSLHDRVSHCNNNNNNNEQVNSYKEQAFNEASVVHSLSKPNPLNLNYSDSSDTDNEEESG